jgi:uncharacterized protein YbgA (DUF1722 family)/uncharacterized protein YbbK (DUF523 family)
MYKFSPDSIQVGISSCLLGQEVRYDGGHKRSPFCTDSLQPFVSYVPICPEMGVGLGSPRPTIRLELEGQSIIAKCQDGRNLTSPLEEFAYQTAQQLNHLSGYIFCAKSPTCGMERVKIYRKNGHSLSDGVGIYARHIMQMYPALPVEENGRLNDAQLRENFITRLYAYHNWKTLLHEGITPASLIEFHSQYKYMLMAHHPHSYKTLGQLLSNLSGDLDSVVKTYELQFMRALKHIATRKNQCNTLQHIHGYFKDKMTQKQRAELIKLIEDYRMGSLPIHAPLTLIQHYLSEHPNDYIAQQHYLTPHPPKLALRYGL